MLNNLKIIQIANITYKFVFICKKKPLLVACTVWKRLKKVQHFSPFVCISQIFQERSLVETLKERLLSPTVCVCGHALPACIM